MLSCDCWNQVSFLLGFLAIAAQLLPAHDITSILKCSLVSAGLRTVLKCRSEQVLRNILYVSYWGLSLLHVFVCLEPLLGTSVAQEYVIGYIHWIQAKIITRS